MISINPIVGINNALLFDEVNTCLAHVIRESSVNNMGSFVFECLLLYFLQTVMLPISVV